MDNDSMSCVMSQSTTNEESGWTLYFNDFDEFMANGKEENNNTNASSSSFTSSSSSRLFHLSSSTAFKRSSFKKRKGIKGGLALDEDLEDTASSTIHNPKEKSDGNSTQSKRDDPRSGPGFIGREMNEFTELKKRGLCLVPVSVFVNYK